MGKGVLKHQNQLKGVLENQTQLQIVPYNQKIEKLLRAIVMAAHTNGIYRALI